MRDALCKRQSERIIDASMSDLTHYKRSIQRVEQDKQRLRRVAEEEANDAEHQNSGTTTRVARWMKKVSMSFVDGAEEELTAWEQQQEDSINNMSLTSFDLSANSHKGDSLITKKPSSATSITMSPEEVTTNDSSQSSLDLGL